MNDDELRTIARKRLSSRADLVGYLTVWGAVSLLVTFIWAVTNIGGYFWPGWVIFGMGVGALFKTAAYLRPFAGVVTEQDVAAEVERLRRL